MASCPSLLLNHQDNVTEPKANLEQKRTNRGPERRTVLPKVTQQMEDTQVRK
jgi:hypothetical protein